MIHPSHIADDRRPQRPVFLWRNGTMAAIAQAGASKTQYEERVRDINALQLRAPK